MATNNNGNLLDSAGEVAIDFVWGNFPIQPNDARPDTTAGRLDPEADNHIIALSGWGGYPQFTANSAGEDVAGDAVDYVLVPSVLGLTTALAQDAMKDASLVVTTANAAANARTDITRFDATSATVANIYATSANTNYPVGTKVTLVAGTPAGANPVNLPAYAIGTFTVTAVASNQITVSGSGFTVANTTGINATATLGGTAGTIRVQSIAAGANNTAPGAAVTITPWATAS
jgi:hypothetical protein